ncbi:phosphatase PAP2 family protein [Butyrivibrio sp. YAB3001]|uniref:phosphatase PAP2 family protein n=1 Tax=Butyrivibrio sp. YAB3001 TaxID=1520812 RepID=UPI0008F677BB|nr:phosphatase PAP2 family protein [Butyrivibrio sp. YAB3001]SFC92863.1 undecaprenyl-diphosphatase [Butyrivibrio sp. YAB3001]
MEKRIRNNYLFGGLFFALFLVLIILVKAADVAAVGPNDTSIGLSHINVAVHEFFGINDAFYKLTEVFGILAILIAGFFAVFGGAQLIYRKRIDKMDKEILALGGLYTVVVVLYAFFEKVIINYRPVIEESGEVEASFPSSHTMLICVIMGSFIMVLDKYIRNQTVKRIVSIAAKVVILLTVIGRLVCGVHWFTDILGGVLISMALLCVFGGVLKQFQKN